jgi:ATP phosphoribosyltransferase regulatory subunit
MNHCQSRGGGGVIRTLEGMRDKLYDECAERRKRESGLAELFSSRGFCEVSTPVLERYELFTRLGSPLAEEMMIKTIGRDGHICVLRPDNTAPIARLAAARLNGEPTPLKLWYAQPVYRGYGNGYREHPQAGVEIIGGFEDAELIELAYQAAGLFFRRKPQIEISHAGVFEVMLRDIDDKAKALSLIDRKNFAGLRDEFPDHERLLALLRLSGGAEAIDEAERMVSAPEAFQTLRGLLRELPDLTVDFSLSPSFGYYTGVYFKGYAEGAADAVLTGGRYDKLLGLLDRDASAIGFAVHME